jgi:hypothetical protein
MKLKLTPMFTEADIQKQMDEFADRVFRVTKNELMQVGLQFVRDSRLKSKPEGGFDDQTGNLRSSIGFILMYDGNIIHEDFELSDKGTEKIQGLTAGRGMADDISKEYPKGWAIITVAGMEYASWVEAKSYDVITGSTLGAEAKLEKAMSNVLKAFS